MKTTVSILGCGSSSGVPVLGRGWGACDPTNPKNRRTRTSLKIERGATQLVIDTGPDFRQQALRAGITRIDAVLYTHAHADHMHGIDELRWLNVAMHKPIPVYGHQRDLAGIEKRFGYVFEPLAEGVDIFYKPVLEKNSVDGPFMIGDFREIVPIEQDHGYGKSLGFRFGNVAYSTDVVAMQDDSLEQLKGLDLWVLGCLWMGRDHATHAHWEKVKTWIDQAQPKQVILTHMSYLMDYAELEALTPDFVTPAYDGMVIAV